MLSVRDDAGETSIAFAPITHAVPKHAAYAIEIPLLIKQHLGLDSERSWIVTSELNIFNWPGPDLRPVRRGAKTIKFDYGVLPPKFFIKVREKILETIRARKLHSTTRSR